MTMTPLEQFSVDHILEHHPEIKIQFYTALDTANLEMLKQAYDAAKKVVKQQKGLPTKRGRPPNTQAKTLMREQTLAIAIHARAFEEELSYAATYLNWFSNEDYQQCPAHSAEISFKLMEYFCADTANPSRAKYAQKLWSLGRAEDKKK